MNSPKVLTFINFVLVVLTFSVFSSILYIKSASVVSSSSKRSTTSRTSFPSNQFNRHSAPLLILRTVHLGGSSAALISFRSLVCLQNRNQAIFSCILENIDDSHVADANHSMRSYFRCAFTSLCKHLLFSSGRLYFVLS